MTVLLLMACGGGDGGSDNGPADVQHGADDGYIETGPADGEPCDDGDPCTMDDVWLDGVCAGTEYDCQSGSPFCVHKACDGEGGCVVDDVKADFCFLDGACYQDGVANPKDACGECDASADQMGWSTAAGVTACSDGNACTVDDHCEDGKCAGTPLDCDDGDDCTDDHCDEALGCMHDNKEGPCEDGDLCSLGDSCVDGVCVGGAEVPDCNDDNPCTVDTCDPASGCVNVLDPAEACDDQNDCTLDSCNQDDGCAYDNVEGPCEDGDLCTSGDYCLNGECQTGANATECDDDNTCTEDTCNPLFGCIHAKLTGQCDDGWDCTYEDTCLGGQCIGKKTADCPDCEYDPNPHANKVTVFQIGTTGHPGQGLDLDDDPDTCAPTTDCSGGIDNELGLLAVFLNPGVTEAVDNGYLTYVLEFKDFKDDGTPFEVLMHGAYLHDSNPDCDFQSNECAYYVVSASFAVDCSPLANFDNAKLVDGHLKAGGNGYGFAVKTTLMGGGALEIGVSNIRIEADVQLNQGESQVVGMQGFMGGAVDKAELLLAIDSLPDDVFPLDKETIKGMLDTLIVNDLDSDGDGVDDAASISIRFDTIPADLVAPGEG